jgi:hypothetical protein
MRSAEADEFIRNLGIDLNHFKSIQKNYQEEFRSIIEKTMKVEKLLDARQILPDVTLNRDSERL